MRTDTQLYQLFRDNPKLLLDLLNLTTEDDYKLQSVSFKQLERTVDGLFSPGEQGPDLVIEFQAYRDEDIYFRAALSRGLHAKNNKHKKVFMILIFLDQKYDPKTQPWYDLSQAKNPYFQVYYLEEMLDHLTERNPAHPLTHLFAPVTVKDTNHLKDALEEHYQGIIEGNLENQRSALEVFLSWLSQRFPQREIKEAVMMFADLPPLEETKIYQELQQMKREAREEGGREMLNRLFEKGFLTEEQFQLGSKETL